MLKKKKMARMIRGILVQRKAEETIERTETKVLRPRIRHMQSRRMKMMRVGGEKILYDSIVRPGQQVRIEILTCWFALGSV